MATKTKQQTPSYFSRPLAVIHADFDGICAECGNYVELKDASRDHVIPRSRGGGNGRDNIVLMHKSCNNLKGDDIRPLDWKQQLERATVIPQGYCCEYCGMEILKWHKKHKYVSKIFRNGKVIALHKWCNEDRIKYGSF